MPIYTYTTLNESAAAFGTQANGINDSGQISGTYFDDAFETHGFLLSGGAYTTADDPLANHGDTTTHLQGINGNGDIVGWYFDSSFQEHGLIRSSGGTYATLDVGTLGTKAEAFGINNGGQIVGDYTDSSNVHRGFLFSGTPPSTILRPRLPAARGPRALTARPRSSGITPTPAATTASSTTPTAAATPPSTIPSPSTAPLRSPSTTQARSSASTTT